MNCQNPTVNKLMNMTPIGVSIMALFYKANNF